MLTTQHHFSCVLIENKNKHFGYTIQNLELEKQKIRLEEMLQRFGTKYLDHIDKLKAKLVFPLQKQDAFLKKLDRYITSSQTDKSWKTAYFTDLNWYFYTQLHSKISTQFQFYQPIDALFSQIQQKKEAKNLAIIILNNLYLRELLDIDLIEVKQIYAQKHKIYLERNKLNANLFPLNHQKTTQENKSLLSCEHFIY